jgi:diguanylate cyclase (GGDEF)-like protein
VSIDAFAAQDVAFVEVLARILASQLEGRDVRAKLQHAIEHDALTGLLNRAAFRSRVVRAVASGTGMVAMIDIDHFRDVNRDLGQIGGDSLLVEFGAALEGERRDGEVVARLGDDKFGVLIPEDFDRDGEVDVFARLMSFARAIDRPFSLGGRNTRDELQVNARIGVARFPQDGRDVETIFARALGAVEGAHGGGRPRIEFFDPRLETEFAERRKLLSDLRNAIDARHFVVHYQPTLDLVRRRIIGAEALVRWSDPVRGLIPPDRFIGPAHDAGLLSRITELVLDTVVEDLPMLAQGRPSFRVYVNFTMDQLRESDLIDRAVHRLGERKLPASLLGIEITESMAMEDIDATLTALRGVRARGIRVALDDFGTGYSSLSHLKNLPVDMVKIDRSFVAGLPDEDRDCALVESFLTICRTFEFTSLAEGIESAQTEAWLAERGCNAGQGYLFARPLARPDLLAWMEGRAAGLA